MPDTDLNLTVDVTGNTAAIATDYTTSGVTNAHVQVVKVSFGSPTTATRVTTSSPFPVDIRASNTPVTITGGIYGIGNFRILNGVSGITSIPLIVSGTTATGYTPVQINGYIQGITTGIPVGVTGSVGIRDGARIQGITDGIPVGITGGRYLSYTTDTITVTGSVNVAGGRYMLQATDSVRVYSAADGSTVIPISLRDGSNKIIGSSGGALNVNLVNTVLGITANVSIGAIVGISQADQTVPLFIAGATTGPAVRVKGSSSDSVPVTWSTSLPVEISNNSLAINDTSLIATINNLPISKIKENTDKLSTINTAVTQTGVNANVVSFSRSSTVYTGTVGITSGTPITLNSKSLNTGITLKASSVNTVDVMLKGNGVDSSFAYPLSPSDILFIETDNMSNISFYVVSGSAKVFYIAS